MSEAVFAQELTKAYNGKTVVDHLNLSVKRGTVFGLLGANGAGYTFLEQSFGAVGAVAICAGGLMGLPQAVSTMREYKILKRLRGSLLRFLGSWALTMLSTLSVGMLVGGVARDTKQASVIASVLYFPMLVFSGTTLPLEVMPRTMQKIVSLFPLTQGITMMKNAFIGADTGSVLLPVCVMLGLTALCTALSVRFFRWE